MTRVRGGSIERYPYESRVVPKHRFATSSSFTTAVPYSDRPTFKLLPTTRCPLGPSGGVRRRTREEHTRVLVSGYQVDLRTYTYTKETGLVSIKTDLLSTSLPGLQNLRNQTWSNLDGVFSPSRTYSQYHSNVKDPPTYTDRHEKS